MSSAGHEYGYDGEQDFYEPQQYGMRNFAGRDGYAPPADNGNSASDRYTPAYSDGAPRRRSSAAALDDYYRSGTVGAGRGAWGEPGAERGNYHTNTTRDLTRRARGRSHGYDDYSSDDDEYDRRGRHGRGGRGVDDDDEDDDGKHKRGRSLSAFGKRISSYFGPDEHHDGEGNNDAKKWGATIAGALAGGLVGRMANKHTVAPAALGAFIGGFTAREAEKKFYRRREIKEKEGRKHAELKYGAD